MADTSFKGRPLSLTVLRLVPRGTAPGSRIPHHHRQNKIFQQTRWLWDTRTALVFPLFQRLITGCSNFEHLREPKLLLLSYHYQQRTMPSPSGNHTSRPHLLADSADGKARRKRSWQVLQGVNDQVDSKNERTVITEQMGELMWYLPEACRSPTEKRESTLGFNSEKRVPVSLQKSHFTFLCLSLPNCKIQTTPSAQQ